MAKFRDQMVNILDRYIDEVDAEPASLDDVVDWGLAQGLYHPEPQDIRKMFKSSLSDSLRQERRFDGTRWYRAKHSIRTSIGGVQLVLWADIDKNASYSFMKKSTADRRKAVADDAFRLKMDVDHYNEANPEEPKLQLVLDFTEDVAEMEAAAGLEDAA